MTRLHLAIGCLSVLLCAPLAWSAGEVEDGTMIGGASPRQTLQQTRKGRPVGYGTTDRRSVLMPIAPHRSPSQPEEESPLPLLFLNHAHSTTSDK